MTSLRGTGEPPRMRSPAGENQTAPRQPDRPGTDSAAKGWVWDGSEFHFVGPGDPYSRGGVPFRRWVQTHTFNPFGASRIIQSVRLGLPFKELDFGPKVVARWRRKVPAFDTAFREAIQLHEVDQVWRVIGLLETGTPGTPAAIRKATGGTPRETRRWLEKALAREAES